MDDTDLVDPKDVRTDVMRAGGAGGQVRPSLFHGRTWLNPAHSMSTERNPQLGLFTSPLE